MKQPKVLTTCIQCKLRVPAVDSIVRKTFPHGDGVMMVFECPHCMSVQKYFMSAENLKSRHDMRARELADDSDRRAIGILVKGFSVDLEAVESVEDFQLYWRYQETVSPESIMVEGSR